MVPHPAGYLEYQLPISLKAVVIRRGQVPLLKNERNEWELPGASLSWAKIQLPAFGLR